MSTLTYKGRRLFKFLPKNPAYTYDEKFIGFFNSKDQLLSHLITLGQDTTIFTKVLSHSKENGFIRKFIVSPTKLTI